MFVQVNYATGDSRAEPVQTLHDAADQDYDTSGFSDSENESGDMKSDDEFDENGEERAKRRRSRREGRDDKLPPLLARVNGQIEVSGFFFVAFAFFSSALN